MRTVLCLLFVTACSPRATKLVRPESALWDAATDTYLVSNIGENPFGDDEDGFIARFVPGGKPERWIGSLNAPRGLALVGDRLLVADLKVVRMFDRTTGKPLGEIAVPGAVMLNDLAAHGDKVLATDSGLPAAKQPADAKHGVYEIDPIAGTVKALIAGPDLGRPNGVAVVSGEIWIATYGSGELYRICGGEICDRQKLPGGGLDGIVVDGDRLYVSSWEAEAVFAGRPGGEWRPVIEKVAAPADIGWDAKRRRLLIPKLEAGELDVREVR